MKTKILIATFFAFLLSAISHAQDITFGARGGINFQNLTGKDATGDKFSNKLMVGFNVGGNVEIPVAPDFYLQPGLLFTTKGAKSKDVVNWKETINYFEIPVNFLYKPALGDGKLLLGFGPYAAYAVGGKYKIGNTSTTITFGKDPGEMKRFDAGANLLAGYEFSNKLSFQLNAGLGFINLANRSQGDKKSSLKNTGFGISAGYRFN